MEHTYLNTSRNPSVDSGVAYAMDAGDPWRRYFEGSTEFRSPAGSVDATLVDMDKYMIALLGGKGSNILSRAAWQTMFTVHARNAPQVSGFGMAWMIEEWNATTVYEHGGSHEGFHSILALFPQNDAGIFISCFCVMAHAAPARPGAVYAIDGHHFNEMIYREFLGVAPVSAPVQSQTPDYAGVYEGEGRDTRWPARILRLIDPKATAGMMRVQSGPGTLTINGRGPYLPSAKDVFRDAAINANDPYVPYPNWESIIFIRDSTGAVVRATRALSYRTMLRLEYFQRPDVSRRWGALGVVLAALGFLTFYWRMAAPNIGRLVRRAEVTTAAVAVGGVLALFAALALGWLRPESTQAERLAVTVELVVLSIVVIGTALAASVAAIALSFGAVKLQGSQRLAVTLHATAVALGAVFLAWLLINC